MHHSNFKMIETSGDRKEIETKGGLGMLCLQTLHRKNFAEGSSVLLFTSERNCLGFEYGVVRESKVFRLRAQTIKSQAFAPHFILASTVYKSTCLVVAKEEKVLERVALSDTGRCWEITSRVLRSQLSVVSLAEVVSSVSLVWSTKRPVVYWRSSLRTSSVMLSHTLSTPSARQ